MMNLVDKLIKYSSNWVKSRENSMEEGEMKEDKEKKMENCLLNENVQKIPETYNYEEIVGVAVKKEEKD